MVTALMVKTSLYMIPDTDYMLCTHLSHDPQNKEDDHLFYIEVRKSRHQRVNSLATIQHLERKLRPVLKPSQSGSGEQFSPLCHAVTHQGDLMTKTPQNTHS